MKPAIYFSSPEIELDCHAMNTLEVVDFLEKNFDSLYLRDIKFVRVICGHGTGVLRRAVQSYLESSRYVSNFTNHTFWNIETGSFVVELI